MTAPVSDSPVRVAPNRNNVLLGHIHNANARSSNIEDSIVSNSYGYKSPYSAACLPGHYKKILVSFAARNDNVYLLLRAT